MVCPCPFLRPMGIPLETANLRWLPDEEPVFQQQSFFQVFELCSHLYSTTLHSPAQLLPMRVLTETQQLGSPGQVLQVSGIKCDYRIIVWISHIATNYSNE